MQPVQPLQPQYQYQVQPGFYVSPPPSTAPAVGLSNAPVSAADPALSNPRLRRARLLLAAVLCVQLCIFILMIVSLSLPSFWIESVGQGSNVEVGAWQSCDSSGDNCQAVNSSYTTSSFRGFQATLVLAFVFSLVAFIASLLRYRSWRPSAPMLPAFIPALVALVMQLACIGLWGAVLAEEVNELLGTSNWSLYPGTAFYLLCVATAAALVNGVLYLLAWNNTWQSRTEVTQSQQQQYQCQQQQLYPQQPQLFLTGSSAPLPFSQPQMMQPQQQLAADPAAAAMQPVGSYPMAWPAVPPAYSPAAQPWPAYAPAQPSWLLQPALTAAGSTALPPPPLPMKPRSAVEAQSRESLPNREAVSRESVPDDQYA